MSKQTPPGPAGDRLESWKEIAAHFDRSVRTVRRWEEREGMPVRRHWHGKGSSVFAFRSELDRWWVDRGRVEPRAAASPVPPARRIPGWSGWVAAAAVALLALGNALLHRAEQSSAAPTEDVPALRVLVVSHGTTDADVDRLDRVVRETLRKARTLAPVPPDRLLRVLERMRRSAGSELDTATAREVCLRDGAIDAVLEGRIATDGAGYTVSLEMIEPAGGASIAAWSARAASADRVPETVDRVAASLLRWAAKGLRIPRRTEPPLPAVTTRSFHALELYHQAGELMREREPAAAEHLLRRALEADPEFASAAVRLAWSLRLQGSPQDSSVELARRAAELGALVTEQERDFIEGSLLRMEGRLEEAAAALTALLAVDERHREAHERLADLFVELERGEPAARHRARVAELLPGDFLAQYAAARTTVEWGADPGAASTYVGRARQLVTTRTALRHPDAVSWVELFAARDRWRVGDVGGVVASLDGLVSRVRTAPSELRDLLHDRIGRMYLALGRIDDARSSFDGISAPHRRHERRALVLFAAGDQEALRRHLLRGTNYEDPITPVLMLAAGLRPSAERWLAERERAFPGSVHCRTLRGILDLGREREPTPGETGGPAPTPEDRAVLFARADMLAHTLEARGDLLRAVEIMEGGHGLRGAAAFSDTGLYWIRCQAYLARLYREVGRETDALRIESELLALLRTADPDFPLLVELRARGDATG